MKDEKRREQKDENILDPELYAFLCKIEHIHNKAIFDAINEALDNLRPYGLEGPPMPWDKSTRTLSSNFTNVATLSENLVEKLVSQIKEWVTTFMGALPNSEMYNSDRLVTDREELLSIWDVKLSENFVSEMNNQETRWQNYNLFESKIKIEVSEAIFNTIIEETANLLSSLSN